MSPMDDRLTPRERAMFASLPRQRVGSAALEDRVVSSLVQRGLLRRTMMAFGRAPWRVLSQLGATAAVFIIGVLVGRTGQAANVVHPERDVVAVGVVAGGALAGTALLAGTERQSKGSFQPVMRRMGSATMGAALVMLPPDTVDALLRIARDFARVTVRAASLQLARSHADTMVAMARVVGVPEPVWR
jgi:hypothetical protein